mmetsp:Transcript_53107/g.68113  ORF Transcript_53107/g.68113 Transcript_53107/m.68113 type:complete len:830 (-) Transcript_53107:21-2510(-)
MSSSPTAGFKSISDANITLRKTQLQQIRNSKNSSSQHQASFDEDYEDYGTQYGENDEVRTFEKKASNISLFGSGRRRSSMVAEAKQNSVKCNLPCFDEEDDGIPPFCRHPSCPLDHRNKLLNLGSQDGGYADCCVMFGNVGFPFFDHRRGSMMGIATISTLMAIFITTYGVLSLAKDDKLIQLTYWVRASAYNMSSTDEGPPLKLQHEDAFEVYIGLTSMLQKECVAGTGCFHHDLRVIEWWKRKDLGQSEDGMDLCRSEARLDVFCDECRDVAVNNITAAFFACVTLLFALFGCINRMKFISDCPVQKLLGCFTDTWGALSLTYALYDFENRCLWNLPDTYHGYKLEYVRGPGIYMYMFCALSGFIRAILHWLTPLPGQGIGCRLRLPARDTAVETLAALNKWQQDTKQHIEVQFMNANQKMGQGINTAMSGATTGLKAAGEVTVKSTTRIMRSSIAIATGTRRPSWGTSGGSESSRNRESGISELGQEEGEDWENVTPNPNQQSRPEVVEVKELNVDELRTIATKAAEEHGPDSDQARSAWQLVFDAQSSHNNDLHLPPPPAEETSTAWWSPLALRNHLGKKFAVGDKDGNVTRASVRMELSKIDISGPTNVQHVVSAKINADQLDSDQFPETIQPGSTFELSSRRLRTSSDAARLKRMSLEHQHSYKHDHHRYGRRSLGGLEEGFGEGELALQRLSVGLTRRTSSTNPLDAFYELNRPDSETFSYSRRSFNKASSFNSFTGPPGTLNNTSSLSLPALSPSPTPPSPPAPSPAPPSPMMTPTESPSSPLATPTEPMSPKPRAEALETSARNSGLAINLFGSVKGSAL